MASMPKAIVAAHSAASNAGRFGNDIARGHVQRQVVDLKGEIIGETDLVDRGAACREIRDHLFGHRLAG